MNDDGENLVRMIRPIATESDVSARISCLYGFQVTRIEQLEGYDDLNFYVECTSKNSDTTRCICKILNANDSENPNLIESQHRFMLHLSDGGVSVPKPIANVQGQHYSLEQFGQHRHVFRLLEFVPGNKLNDSPPSPDLYRNVGDSIGELYSILKTYEDVELKSKKSLWILESVPELHKYVHAVPDKERQELVIRIVKEFEERVIPVMHEIEKGIVHGDLNEHNILVEGSNVVGIIDFGDINFAPVLFEVAISLTYMIFHAKDVSVGKPFFESYRKHRQLTDLEADLLPVCVRARAAQSLTLGCYSALGDPNNEYILSSQKNGWTVFRRLSAVPDSELLTSWGFVRP